MRTRLVAGLVLLAVLGAGAALWRSRDRARHLAVPVLSDPSLPEPPPLALPEGPPCALAELARVGGRVTAVLAASDGWVHVGTFEGGLLRLPPPGGEPSSDPALLALSGRERFVNALAEHEGLVWAATQGGAVAFDGERRVLSLLPRDGVTALEVAGGALYAGTARGVFRLSVAGGAEPVEARGPAGEPLRVSALAASGGSLWIGTASGVYSLPLASVEAPLLARTARWVPLVFGDPPATTNVVTALAPLGGGVVAGTDDGGLVRVRRDGAVVAVRTAEARANEVNPGAAAGVSGGAALGTQGGGLLLARPRGDGLLVERIARGEISAVAAKGRGPGDLLLGTADGAVLSATCAPAGIHAQATHPPGDG